MIFPDNSASWEPTGGFEEGEGMIPEIGRGVPLIKVFGVGGGGLQRGQPHVQRKAARR